MRVTASVPRRGDPANCVRAPPLFGMNLRRTSSSDNQYRSPAGAVVLPWLRDRHHVMRSHGRGPTYRVRARLATGPERGGGWAPFER